MSRSWVAALAAITAGGLVLRALGIDQSLFGDEWFTVGVIANGPRGVLDGIDRYELNPPLFYFLAALLSELGDPTLWPRIISLVAGVAALPLVFLLGRRTVGDAAGAIAAGLVAVSPFAIFYSTEARGYALLMLLVLIATLALLSGVREGRPVAWVIFVVAAAAALLTHYSAAYALAAMLAWAFVAAPERRKALLLSAGAIALAFAPWLPAFADQLGKPPLATPLSPRAVVQSLVHTAAGHPLTFLPLGRFPGRGWLALLALAALLAVVGAAWSLRRRGGDRWRRPSAAAVLLVLLACAAPAGIVLVSLIGGEGLLYPRNFISAVPAAAVLAGALLATLPRAAAVALTVVVLGALSTAAVKLIDPSWQRPDTKAAARAVDARAGGSDSVVEVPGYLLLATASPDAGRLLVDTPLARDIAEFYERPHRRFALVRFRSAGGASVGVADPRAWRQGGDVFVAGVAGRGKFALPAELRLPGPPGGGRRFRLTGAETFPGLAPVGVVRYSPVR